MFSKFTFRGRGGLLRNINGLHFFLDIELWTQSLIDKGIVNRSDHMNDRFGHMKEGRKYPMHCALDVNHYKETPQEGCQ